MNRTSMVLLIGAALGVAGLSTWARLRSHSVGAEPTPLVIQSEETHKVTPEMASASREMLGRPAPGFTKPAADGSLHELGAMLREGPVVLTFIKKGCPCSEAAQTFFNSLHDTYPKAAMRGVIDVEAEPAREWAARFHVDYPLLVDPEEELVRAYQAENSAYVVIISPEGQIVKHWPGYSESMLRELALMMASMTGSSAEPPAFPDAPEELYSGCPFEL